MKDVIPNNPYPKKIFTMTFDDFEKEVPDEKLRTRIAGCLSRWQFDTAKKVFLDAIKAELRDWNVNIKDYYEITRDSETYTALCMGIMADGFKTEADALKWCLSEFEKYLVVPNDEC